MATKSTEIQKQHVVMLRDAESETIVGPFKSRAEAANWMGHHGVSPGVWGSVHRLYPVPTPDAER